MSEIVFSVLILALLIFILWDGRRPVKSPSRVEMVKGVSPGSEGGLAASVVIAMVCFFIGFDQFFNPDTPPFNGRGAPVKFLMYLAFGEKGPGILLVSIGMLFLWLAYRLFQSRRNRR